MERIKSELRIEINFLEFIIDLKDDEQNGANKLFRWYSEAMIGEINMAHNVINNQDFLQASEKVKTAKERVNLVLFEQVIRQVSGAISAVQTVVNGLCRFEGPPFVAVFFRCPKDLFAYSLVTVLNR